MFVGKLFVKVSPHPFKTFQTRIYLPSSGSAIMALPFFVVNSVKTTKNINYHKISQKTIDKPRRVVYNGNREVVILFGLLKYYFGNA